MKPTPAGRAAFSRARAVAAFTLIELIIVMAILTIAVSMTAPVLSSFFRGRTLDHEARQLLSLSREGRSRAESEGVPMELWFDTRQGMYGLESAPDYNPQDPRAQSYHVDTELRIDVPAAAAGNAAPALNGLTAGSLASTPAPVKSNHPNLPCIRFLPDGTVSETSPSVVKLIGPDESSFSLVLSSNRLNYELRSQPN
ncbi:MAG TPA: prepilin-type N-terminal cleavage/methylation domain-containing protein [Verrucomicrobiae bacterium]|nr:prepilin-type N-terminal cleavage/methylation domain-containing protein [Verrucomicrobiae bacterium]